ncbi:MAG: ribbon-helix-helix protein, CopG family [Thermoleophilia bacterium]|nr:ribbon-helix-helix protein, CopG family [Thermoleophilia bacterium]
MRTTVTLDDDLAASLRELARERGDSFRQVLNDTVRAGLARGRASGRRPYRVETARLELRPGIDLDKALRLAGELEDEEIVRKLERRK